MSSNCQITIRRHQEDFVYQGGERLQGEFTVHPNASFECKDIKLSLQWRTHGQGNVASGVVYEASLYTGQLMQGRDMTFQFDIAVPNGPATYHGHYLSVDWSVVAEVKIGWLKDVRQEEDIAVRGVVGLPYTHMDAKLAAIDGQHKGENLVLGCATLFLGAFACMGLFSVVGSLMGGNVFSALFSALFVLAPGVGLGFLWRNRLAQRKLGQVSVTVANEAVQPGERLEVTLGFTPTTHLDLNGIKATLKCMERVVSGTGTRRTTRTHHVHSEELILEAAGARVRPQLPYSKAFQFLIPKEAPPSFRAANNGLYWLVDVHIDIPGWPDWHRELPIVVGPSATAAADAELCPWTGASTAAST